MAYFVGAANSLSDLRSALESALLSTGWSAEGGALSSNGLRLALSVTGDGTSIGSKLQASVGNSPADLAPITPWIGPLSNGAGATSWAWPVAYNLHVMSDPLEVYLVVQYGSFTQMLAFGKSPSSGNSGSGNWVHGVSSAAQTTLTEKSFTILPEGITTSNDSYQYKLAGCAPFFLRVVYHGVSMASTIHGAINAAGEPVWSASGIDLSAANGISSSLVMAELMRVQPNSWNLECALLPCQVFQRRLENKVSLIGELVHLRYLRNDYISDGEVVTLGPDRWKVYPIYRRNTAARNGTTAGTSPLDHSGTLAIAIRYDGP